MHCTAVDDQIMLLLSARHMIPFHFLYFKYRGKKPVFILQSIKFTKNTGFQQSLLLYQSTVIFLYYGSRDGFRGICQQDQLKKSKVPLLFKGPAMQSIPYKLQQKPKLFVFVIIPRITICITQKQILIFPFLWAAHFCQIFLLINSNLICVCEHMCMHVLIGRCVCTHVETRELLSEVGSLLGIHGSNRLSHLSAVPLCVKAALANGLVLVERLLCLRA